MKAVLAGGTYEVVAGPDDVAEFMSSWPCSGLDPSCAYRFEFSAANGDLVDVTAHRDGLQVEHDDGAALAALSEDACLRGAADLGLDEVVSLRSARQPAP